MQIVFGYGHGFNKKSRNEIARIIGVLGKTDNLLIQYPGVVIKAMTFYIYDEFDIVDCVLCAFNAVIGYDVFTFGKEMKALLLKIKKTRNQVLND